MVGEEDSTEEISHFAPEILLGKKIVSNIVGNEQEGMACFFNAGETHQRMRFNLHDSISLDTKRIQNGFQLQMFPYLQE